MQALTAHSQASHSVFKDKWVHDLQKQISEFLTSHIDWIGVQAPNDEARYTKIMDYACGNGIVSRVGSSYQGYEKVTRNANKARNVVTAPFVLQMHRRRSSEYYVGQIPRNCSGSRPRRVSHDSRPR